MQQGHRWVIFGLPVPQPPHAGVRASLKMLWETLGDEWRRHQALWHCWGLLSGVSLSIPGEAAAGVLPCHPRAQRGIQGMAERAQRQTLVSGGVWEQR